MYLSRLDVQLTRFRPTW